MDSEGLCAPRINITEHIVVTPFDVVLKRVGDRSFTIVKDKLRYLVGGQSYQDVGAKVLHHEVFQHPTMGVEPSQCSYL